MRHEIGVKVMKLGLNLSRVLKFLKGGEPKKEKKENGLSVILGSERTHASSCDRVGSH